MDFLPWFDRSNTALRSVFRNDFWGLPLSDLESHKSYRPLTVLSFRLNYYLHGLWSPGFHMVNIAAHGIVCVLYLWCCMAFGLNLVPSFIASLLFASHPIHTEAVSQLMSSPGLSWLTIKQSYNSLCRLLILSVDLRCWQQYFFS